MPTDRKPPTADEHGVLWSQRPRDWAAVQEPLFRPIYEAVFERVRMGSGTRLLDAGCGAGLALQIAASRGARVSGVDAAEGMLQIARERVPDGEFHRTDLETLPFPDATFDVVTGFNSFQFAANPLIALREARRVAKPRGLVAIVTWGDPEGMEAARVVTALRSLVPPPSTDAPGPFALSPPGALEGFARDAGLTPTETFDVEVCFSYPDETTALRALSSGGSSARARQYVSEEAIRKAHVAGLAPFRRHDGSFHARATFRCLLAGA